MKNRLTEIKKKPDKDKKSSPTQNPKEQNQTSVRNSVHKIRNHLIINPYCGKTGSTTTIYSHLTQSIQYRLMRY